MVLDNISLSTLRVFEEVYRHRNMSKAASHLSMTQPGVSQHIKSLEIVLEIKLFDRIGKTLVITTDGHQLYESTSPLLAELEYSLESMMKADSELRGIINFGMPIEFGNNVILPLLSKWSSKNKNVVININYDHITRQTNSMLDGSLDFVIADSFQLTKQLQSKTLAKEHLVLCCSKEYATENNISKNSDLRNTDQLDFIGYLENATILKQWFLHHQEKKVDINTKVSLFDVQGISRLIINHMGLGILPMHIIKRNKIEDKLIIIKETKEPLHNEISLVKITQRSLSRACIEFIDFLNESLA